MKKLLRADALARTLAISRSTLWRWCKDKADFPRPKKLSLGVTVWIADEVEEWLNLQKEVPIMKK